MNIKHKLRRWAAIASIALATVCSPCDAYSEEPKRPQEDRKVEFNEKLTKHFAARIINWTGKPYFQPEKVETGRNELLLPSYATWLEYSTSVNSRWSSNIILNLRKPMDLDEIDLSDINKKTIISHKEFAIDEIVLMYKPNNRIINEIRGGVFQQYFMSNTEPWNRTTIFQPALADSLPTSDLGLELRLGFDSVNIVVSGMISPREGGYKDEQGDSHLIYYLRADKEIGNYKLFAGRRMSRENINVLIGGLECSTDNMLANVTYMNADDPAEMHAYTQLKFPFTFWQFQEVALYTSYEYIKGPDRFNIGARFNLGNHFWYKTQCIEKEDRLWGIFELGVDW